MFCVQQIQNAEKKLFLTNKKKCKCHQKNHSILEFSPTLQKEKQQTNNKIKKK